MPETTIDEIETLRRYVEHLWWVRDGSKCELCKEIELRIFQWKQEKHAKDAVVGD